MKRSVRFVRAPGLALLAALTGASQLWAGSDFNADGFDDLAIGVANEEIAGALFAGAAHVLYGADGGLRVTGNQFWHRNRPGLPGPAGAADGFGTGLAGGDFNGDGLDDLAVGAWFEEVGGVATGAVHVLYGTAAAGLTATGNQWIHRESPGVVGSPQVFGYEVTAGDFNDDGFDDLAIGSPRTEVSGISLAGVLHVFFGSAQGLVTATAQFFHQGTPGIADKPQANEFFADTLEAGDFNRDGYADLAIGVRERVGTVSRAGAVHVLPGSPQGLVTSGARFFHQNSPGISDHAGTDDFFGNSLAVGDFDHDGFDDLAIGVPAEDVGGADEAGALHVLKGSADGLRSAGERFIHQNSAGVADQPEDFDSFASALAAGDFDEDGFDDLAVGVRDEGANRSGAVHVFAGSSSGLAITGSDFWHQDSPGILDKSEANDGFGSALSAGDFNGDGRADLAVGIWFEDLTADGCGAVQVLYGGSTGLNAEGNQFWHQNRAGIPDECQETDIFGATLP